MSTPRRRHGGRALMMLAALLASALTAASAQNDKYIAEQQQVHVSTAMIELLAGVIAVFLFIAFSTVYLRHCAGGYAVRSDVDDGRAVALDRSFFMISRRHQRRPRGLDAEAVAAFPTMRYAEAKALRVGTKGGGGNMALECAVCLSEFEDEERLTLLPRCSHAFHPDCIGEWLAGHVTCPVCRCNLDPNCYKYTSSDEEPMMMSFPQANSVSSEVTSLRQDDGAAQPPVAAVVIDVVTEEEEEERVREAMELQQIGNQRRAMRSRSGRRTPVLARSHSTGRSLAVRLDRDMERFTLRLPEHVRREMVAAAGEQSRRGQRAGAGEGSCSRGGSSGPLAGRAARWQSLIVRTFSGKVSLFSASRSAFSSDGGLEVSSSSSSRVRGKRVASVDAAGVPVKGSILRFDRIGGSPSGAKAGTAPAGDEEKAVTQQVRT